MAALTRRYRLATLCCCPPGAGLVRARADSQAGGDQVLGRSLDILVWVAKKVAPELSRDPRPLQ
eukprot:9629958-Alexandrium_andersonii.AAC.1